MTLRDWILGKYWKKKFFPTVMHRIFKKLRRYFPIPLGIRESFREIVARRKRISPFSATRSTIRHLKKGNFFSHLAKKNLQTYLSSTKTFFARAIHKNLFFFGENQLDSERVNMLH